MVFKIVLSFLLLSCSLASAKAGFYQPWGKDSDLVKEKNKSMPALPEKSSVAVKTAEKVILFHQNVISKVDGPRSHFRPTSARYMLLAMKRYGFIKGYIMGCDRLLRENSDPWVYREREIDGQLYKWDPTYK